MESSQQTQTLSRPDARLAAACLLAQRYYQQFYAECFWFCRPDLKVETREDMTMVLEELRSNGRRAGWNAAREIELCL